MRNHSVAAVSILDVGQHRANRRVDHEAYWNNEAVSYDSLYSDEWSLLENAFVAESLRWLSRFSQPRVLDLGCGTGLGYELVRQINPGVQYTGLDLSRVMLERLQHKYPEAAVVENSMDDLSMFASASFEAAICLFGSMSCLPTLRTVLEQSRRVLTPDGILRISVLGRRSFRRLTRASVSSSELHRTRHATDGEFVKMYFYSPQEVCTAAEEEGFRVERFDCFGTFAGVMEWPRLWPLDRMISKRLPALTHTHDAILRPV